MEVYNPQLLPLEIIRLADYYGVYRLIGLRRDPRQGERQRRGRMGEEKGGVITLFLNRIFRHGLANTICAKASLWITLLDVLLHEIGHVRQIRWTEAEYRNNKEQWGYRDCYPERDARCFARLEILRLADLDEDLFMPHHHRDWGYLGARLSRVLAEDAKYIRQAPGFPTYALLRVWSARLNAGDHVACNDPWAPLCTRIHRTSDGRRYRFLTVAQTARRLALVRARQDGFGSLLCLRSSDGWGQDISPARLTSRACRGMAARAG